MASVSISLFAMALAGCGTSPNNTAAVPTFTPAAGTYSAAQTVTISDATPGAVLHCTTDGTTPTTSSPVCPEPLTVAKSETLSAIAAEPGGSPSAAATAAYTINLPAAATPTISPATGAYTTAQSVTLSDATAGSTIYYTTDGTTPTASSTVYSVPLTIPATETVMAIAIASGYADSNIATAAFTISLPAPAPAITPAGGAFTGAQSVTVTDSLSGATIYYTLDGSMPTQTSTPYSGAIAVNVTETVNAVALAPGYSLSPVATASFSLVAATPAISPAAGSFTAVQSVTITDPTVGAAIYYTVTPSGSAPVSPTTSSLVYTGAIQVAASETIQAIAVANGYSQSAAASAAFTVTLPPAATPVISSPGGTFNAAQTVTITDATPSAAIYYTTNGSAPSASNSTVYSGPIQVSSSETLQAIAVAFGSSNSAIASAAFTLVAATPVISPATGIYTAVQSIVITDATAGAAIYYTTNGSTPSATNGTLYDGAISVSANETIQAVAIGSGFSSSAIAVAAFTINLGPAAMPVLSPAGGVFNATQTVTMTDTTPGAAIYYTVNGSIPSASNGILYSGPVPVVATETIEAIALASGSSNSAIASATFSLVAATPAISPATGTYTTVQSVTITDATTGASIYYTTNGTTPTAASGTLYTGPFTVSSNETVQAIAINSGFGNSVAAVAAYTINLVPAATPVISPAAGTFSATQMVTITDATAGAAIYYTINGSVPSATNGTLYSGPITVASSETIEAIATASGNSTSAVASAAFNLVAATPVISPAPGTYTTIQTIAITDTTSGASIYYTTNGTTPSASSGTLYSGPFSVSSSETVEAIAIASGFNNSVVASSAYTVNLPVAAAPVISPAGGNYATQSIPTVTITDATSGATVYYTLDGSVPSTGNGLTYTGPFAAAVTETVKAVAIVSGYRNSSIVSAAFTINQAAAATPTFSPASGTYTSIQSVIVGDTTPNASIYYTTDGSTPSAQHGTLYASAITVSATETIRAVATASGFNDSVIASATYTINLPAAATPTFSPAAGTYTTTQTVILADSTSGATVYYTLDGSTPSAQHGAVYTTAITVSATETIKAIATAPGFNPSAVASATFTINLLPAATPTFSPAGGTYTSAQSVTLGETTTGATIYYTTDGSTPSPQNGTLYTTPIAVSTTETIKAIATAPGYVSSAVASATYTLTVSTPVFSPAAGTYSTSQTVTISAATATAAIYYTTDGSAPSATHGTLYAGPLTISSTETIKAVAIATGFNASGVATATFTINLSAAATPAFSPAAGTYSSAQTVSIADTTTGAAVYYTTDGSTPSATHGTLYAGPVTVSATETLNAIAVASGFSPSAVASATFTINLTAVATPVFSPVAGTYNAPQSVNLTDATAGAAIYYTTDGTTPSASSTLYGGTAITVSATETIQAIAIASGFSNSAVASGTYTLAAATPVISPAGGTFTTATDTITLADATPGAAIYYTITAGTTGTVPTAASTLYSGPFTISASDTVEAIAIETGYTNSSVASASFTQMISTGPLVSGIVSSGGSPIIGASVQLYAAGTTGYASASATIGSAVTTGANGSFSLPYTCPAPPGDLIYVVATGGSISASGASNAGLGLMTALGPCASLTATSITVNEVTTVASVYALAGFASPATGGGMNVGAPAPSVTCPANTIGNSTCNYPGLVNAFATINNLVDAGSGAALSMTPAYAAAPLPFLNTSTVPQARIDTLADILATCVEASSGCSTLFSNVGGSAPADTIQATLDIAQNPGTNVAALYALLQTTPPYTPTLASIGDTVAPGDWTLAISYTGGGLGVDPNDFNDNITNYAIALDSAGNVWVTGAATNMDSNGLIAGFSNQGAPLTPATQYDPVNQFVTQFGGFEFGSAVSQLLIDPSNNLWVTDGSYFTNGTDFSEVSVTPVNGGVPNLSLVQLSSAYMGLVSLGSTETSFAFDPSVNLWISTVNQPMLNEYDSPTGALLTQYSPSENTLADLVFDSYGNLWASGQGDTILFSASTGNETANYAATSGSSMAAGSAGKVYTCNASLNGYLVFNSSTASGPVSTYNVTGGCSPLVVDGAGNLWAVAETSAGNYLTEVSTSGSLITPAVGYTGSSSAEAPTSYAAQYIAIDGSGNLWALNPQDYSSSVAGGNVLVQYVGVAAPTVAPLALATQNGTQGTKP